MEKLKMHSVNNVDENIKKIGSLFPNCLTERKNENGEVEYAIDFDMLKQELSTVVVEGNEERYQFTWPDKKKSILLANSPIAKTLRPCREESIDYDSTENLYIEGDNLDVLKLLQETYLGKVKMVYIDPPYNTGNDFIYEDDFAQNTDEYIANSGQYDEEGNRLVQNTESNGRFHTDWLNMMYSRIKIAKNLLTNDGVICISIDDNELNNLRKMCDEVFGSNNFVSSITVIVKTEGRRYGFFAKTHENILIYAKNQSDLKLNEIEIEGTQFSFSDQYGGYNIKDLRNQNARAFNSLNRPNLRYPFYVDESSTDNNGFCEISTLHKPGFTEVLPITINGFKSVWRWGVENATNNLHNLTARKGSDGVIRVFQKYRKLTQTAKTVWFEKEFISNKGTKELQELLGTGVFDFPKPVSLLKRITEICSDDNCIILDFFSGSSTTAHAVMKLNAEDGGNRKFIMVQLPEETDEKSEANKAGYKNICEIGKERIRRVGAKIKEEVGAAAENLDTGFRVLKLDSTNMKDVYYKPSEYELNFINSSINNIKEDRTPEDLLFQVMLDLGVLLSSKIEEKIINGKKVFNVQDGYLMACFDEKVTEETIKAIAKEKPYYFVMRDSSMANDSVATNFEQIFETYSRDTVRKVL